MSRFSLFASAAVATLLLASIPASAESMNEKTVNVGGAPMYPSKNIVQNAVNSKDHTTLVAAVKAAPSCRRVPSTTWSSPRTRTR